VAVPSLGPLCVPPRIDFFSEEGILPDESLVRIFYHIIASPDRAALACTNRRMEQVYRDSPLWEALFQRHFSNQNRLPWQGPLQQFKDCYSEIDQNLKTRNFRETRFPINEKFLAWTLCFGEKNNTVCFVSQPPRLNLDQLTNTNVTILERDQISGDYKVIQQITTLFTIFVFFEKERLFLRKYDSTCISILAKDPMLKQFTSVQFLPALPEGAGGFCVKGDLLFLGFFNQIKIYQFDNTVCQFIESSILKNNGFNIHLKNVGNFLVVSHRDRFNCDEIWFQEEGVFKQFLDLRKNQLRLGIVCARRDLICIGCVSKGKNRIYIWDGRKPVQTITGYTLVCMDGDLLLTKESTDKKAPYTLWKRDAGSGKFEQDASLSREDSQSSCFALSGGYLALTVGQGFKEKLIKVFKRANKGGLKELFSYYPGNFSECTSAFKEGNLFTTNAFNPCLKIYNFATPPQSQKF
jgi:hypothetical protein